MKKKIFILLLLYTATNSCAEAGAGAGALQPNAAPPAAVAVTPLPLTPAPVSALAAPGSRANRLSITNGAGPNALSEFPEHHPLVPSPKHSDDGFLSSLFDFMGTGVQSLKKGVIDPYRSKRVVILGSMKRNSFFDDYPTPVEQQRNIVDLFNDVSIKAQAQESRMQQLLYIILFAQQHKLPLAPSLQAQLIPHVAQELSRCSRLLQLLQSSQKHAESNGPAGS